MGNQQSNRAASMRTMSWLFTVVTKVHNLHPLIHRIDQRLLLLVNPCLMIISIKKGKHVKFISSLSIQVKNKYQPSHQNFPQAMVCSKLIRAKILSLDRWASFPWGKIKIKLICLLEFIKSLHLWEKIYEIPCENIHQHNW